MSKGPKRGRKKVGTEDRKSVFPDRIYSSTELTQKGREGEEGEKP